MAAVKNLSMAITGVVFSIFVSSSRVKAHVVDFPHTDSPPIDFQQVTSSLTGKAFDFPDVITNPNPPQVLFGGGEVLTFLKSTEDTNGQYVLIGGEGQPGNITPPHIHLDSDEWFYILDEGITLYLGDQIYPEGVIPGTNAPKGNLYAIDTKPGDLFFSPSGQIHAHQITGTTPARELIVASPPRDLDKWFQLGGVPVTDPSNLPEPDFSKLGAAIAVAPDYGLILSSNFGELEDKVYFDVPLPDEIVKNIKNNLADELTALLDNNARACH